MADYDIIKTVDENGVEHVKVVMKEEKPKKKNTANS